MRAASVLFQAPCITNVALASPGPQAGSPLIIGCRYSKGTCTASGSDNSLNLLNDFGKLFICYTIFE